MKKLILLALLAFSVAAYADQCEGHLAYASSGTVVVSTAIGSSAQNGALAYAIFNPFPCTSTGVAFPIKAVDSSILNYYGFALVGVNGNTTPGMIYATTGAVTGPAFTAVGVNNVQSLPWQGGPITLPVGMYMVVLGTTCSTSCAQLLFTRIPPPTRPGLLTPPASRDSLLRTCPRCRSVLAPASRRRSPALQLR